MDAVGGAVLEFGFSALQPLVIPCAAARDPARLRKLIMKIRAKNIRIITPFSRWGILGSEGESDILVIILIIISYACKLTYIFPNN
jgi:hypothetical protein